MPMKLENEKIIRKFLFDEMTEEERFNFEERFLLDEDLFEQVKASEDDLIEKYVRGWMDTVESSKFEKHFLTTKSRRERVEFSRQMIEKVSELKEQPVIVKKNAEETSDESIWNKLAALFFTPKFAMAGALGLIIVAFGGWILFQNFGDGNNEFVKTQTPTPTVPPTPSELPKNNQNDSVDNNVNSQENVEDNSQKPVDNTNENINKAPRKTPKPKPTIKKTPTPKRTPPIRKTAPNPILAVFAGSVRSGGKINVLKLPKNAKGATLQLNLESVDYKIYQAKLTDADGNVLFQRGNLKPRGKRINFNIPAKNLKNGDYIINLFGKNDSGENESVADYQIRVQKK